MTALQNMLNAKGISQHELARRLKVSQPCISITAKKGIKKFSTAKRYADAIGCQAIFLLEDINV